MNGARIPLTGPDARVLKLLAQVVAIGRNEGSFTAADVQRVAEAHLEHPQALRRLLVNERARNAELEAKNENLRATIADLRAQIVNALTDRSPAHVCSDPLAHEGKPRVVDLPVLQARVIAELCTGARRTEVADRLGVSPSGVSTLAWRAARRIGAVDARRAVELVRRGSVIVKSRAA